MRKICSLVFLVGLFFTQSHAQSPTIEYDTVVVYEYEPVKNIFKLSPFHFAEGTFHLSYERMLGSTKSIMLSGGLTSRQRYFQEEPDFGFQEELQVRFYFLEPRNQGANERNFFFFKGLYAGPYATHRFRQQTSQTWDWVTQSNVTIFENINEVGGGVLIGAQMAFGNVFFLDVFTGGGIKRSFGNTNGQNFIGVFSPGYNGVVPKGGFQIGVGF